MKFAHAADTWDKYCAVFVCWWYVYVCELLTVGQSLQGEAKIARLGAPAQRLRRLGTEQRDQFHNIRLRGAASESIVLLVAQTS